MSIITWKIYIYPAMEKLVNPCLKLAPRESEVDQFKQKKVKEEKKE